MRRYLLDTNHIGEAVDRVSCVRDRIQQLTLQGAIVGTCGPVLCELMVGIMRRHDAASNRRRLEGLLRKLRVWPLDLAIAEHYAQAYLELQKAGRALSQVDIILAAFARQLNATLLTSDHDFRALPDIHTENWLSSGKP